MWYKRIPNLPYFDFKKITPFGKFDPDKKKAQKLGIRYRKWPEISKHWLANPGVNKPYLKYWRNGAKFFREIRELYDKGENEKILELQNNKMNEIRKEIKEIFELDPNEYRLIFDSNGSVLCSTLAKIFKNEKGLSLTFTDQGRLIYSALTFEAKTVTKFISNFEQQFGLFDAPLPKRKINIKSPAPRNVILIDIFNQDLTYRSDAKIIEDYYKVIQKKEIDFIFLLHVSRTGRILPVEDLIRIAKKLRPDIFVFVDGAQAVGRMSYEKIKKIIEMADGYMTVGHKALGSMISALCIVKNHVNEFITKKLKDTKFYHLKLFRFENEEQNLEILKRAEKEKKPYYFVSVPELISLKEALKDNYQNFWNFQKIISIQKEKLIKFLNEQEKIHMDRNRVNFVDDIVSFHLENKEKAILLKNYLQDLNPPITIGPLTETYAIRIGIEPKLPDIKDTINYLKEALMKFLKSY